ncbi:TraB/GumN family protein [Caldithrix abyssi]
MKKNLFGLLAVLLIVNILFAGPQHSIWEVIGKQNKVFLVGSFHLLTEDQYPLPSVFDSVYDQSAVVVFEADLDSLSSPAVVSKFLQKGLLTGDRTLKNVLSDSVFTKLKKTFEELGQPTELYLKMKPWLVALTLNQLNMARLGFKAELGIEFYYARKVKEEARPVQSLESVAFQMGLMEKLSEINADELILQTIEDIGRSETTIPELINAWQSGNARALDSLLNASFKDFPEIGVFLLIKRNQAWVEQVERFLRDDRNYLVVVGAGHLVGTEGLVELLRKKGYRLKQL